MLRKSRNFTAENNVYTHDRSILWDIPSRKKLINQKKTTNMMKKLMTLSLALATATVLWAQDQSDVTKFFLSNANFDEKIDYPAGSTENVRFVVKNPDGWTADIAADSTTVGTYAFGFSGTFCGASVPATGYNGQAGGALALSTGQGQVLRYYQEVTLPAGNYTITVASYNAGEKATGTSQLAWVPESGTTRKSRTIRYPLGEWTMETVTFNLTKETSGIIQIGMKAASNGPDNSAKLLIDYIKVESDCDPLADLHSKVEAAKLLDTSVIDPRYSAPLNEAIAQAEAIDTNCTAEEYKAALDALTAAVEVAEFAIGVATAEPDTTGAIPAVTQTNRYVATGANEALMRANMTGSNILERGVCWSTYRNPTVMDQRTTKYFQLNGYIFHVKGLEPATVYYLRPYVMAKNHYVAYGEEVKIVTHAKGTCTWQWDEGAPTAEANTRCRNAMQETIDYFNQWTGIKGFHLNGHYGAQTPTADCSYGGWMRIGPNAAYQAIGTVLHETGHGVGVGTHWRWYECEDTRESQGKYGKWLGREANDVLHFLENNYNSETCYMQGDAVHGWGHNASYDWFVNGADKDKHQELQYIGGMCLLYGLFIDGLCPTWDAPNGISGYTYNFDEEKKYYLMCKDSERGLGNGLLFQRTSNALGWKPYLENAVVSDSAAWYMEFNPQTGYYMFRNALTGKYLTHTNLGSNVTLKTVAEGKAPATTEYFQLMPDRTDVTLKGVNDLSITTHGYWVTWYDPNDAQNRSMQANKYGSVTQYGAIPQATFNYSNAATTQQWIIISEDELPAYQALLGVEPKPGVPGDLDGDGTLSVADITTLIGIYLQQAADGTADSSCDLDGDGNLTVSDITTLITLYLGNTASE